MKSRRCGISIRLGHIRYGRKHDRAQLEAMRPLNMKMRTRKQKKNFVQAGVSPIHKLRAPTDVGNVERFNVQDENSAPEMLKFLDSARQKCAAASRDFDLAITTAMIGHTHHARLAVHEEQANSSLWWIAAPGSRTA